MAHNEHLSNMDLSYHLVVRAGQAQLHYERREFNLPVVDLCGIPVRV